MRVSSYPGWRAPIRTCAIAIGLAATLLLLARVGYWRMFSIFHFYDDEGCILITVRSFIDGHALYDDVFSMYGPLPVLLKWVLFTATGQPVGHDAGRLLSLASWLATSALAGAIALRLTGSLVAGCVGMVFVFQGLGLTTWEPGHPQELCALLLVLVVLLATFVGLKSGRRAVPIVAALGIAAGCLAMSKINVFVFLMLALGAAALAFTPRTRLVVALDIIYAVGLLAAPTMLMRDRLDAPGVRNFALYVTAALVPPLLLAFGRRSQPFLGLKHYLWFAAGLLAAVGTIAGIVLLCGTTPRGLLDGVLLIPLRLGTHFTSPPFNGRWPITVAFCVGALVWLVLERTGRAARTVPALCAAGLRIAYAVRVLAWQLPIVFASYEDIFAYAVPAAILVLLPRAVAERPTGDTFGRLVLAFLAITETLWAYPVLGSQGAFSTFLATLLLVIVAADGCRDWAAICCRWALWPAWTVRGLVPAAVVAFLLPILRLEADAARFQYEHGTPLGLPGAQAIRIDPTSAGNYRRVTEALRALPDTFFTLPGMYSFYFWTEREPPTALNLTNWMYMLDDRQQEGIVAQLAKHPQLRVLVSHELINFWMQGSSPLPPTPLVQYIHAGFAQEIDLGGGTTIWGPQPRPAEPQTRASIASTP